MITEMDEEPLKSLRDIKIEYTEDKPVSNEINTYYLNTCIYL
jgi:hypothetical protein